MKPRLIIKLDTRSDGQCHSVESICGGVTMYQGCNSSDGRVEFDMMDIPTVNCRFGDTITLVLDGRVIFTGKLFEIKRDKDLYARHYVFYDESFYLRNPISYPVPEKVLMSELVGNLLNKYEIVWTRLDSAGEMVDERKIDNQSILDAIQDIVKYVSYTYQKMYILRQNAGKVEFIDVECANVDGFQNSYPLVIDFSNSENISQQTYTYYEFFVADETNKKKSPKKDDGKKDDSGKKQNKPVPYGNPDKDGLGQQDTYSANAQGKIAMGQSKVGSGTRKKSTVKYIKPVVPYKEQAVNLEIAMYAVGGVNKAADIVRDKPTIVKDVDEEKKGYSIGSKGYKLTGEVALWGYLPMIQQVEVFPPEEIVNKLINIRRNPVRKAKFTVLVHGDFHLPGDKLFIGQNEAIASVYVIDSVTTTFSNSEVVQELDIFSWQKTYDIQKMILASHIKQIEKLGGKDALQTFAMKNGVDLIYKKSEGINDAGYIVTDKLLDQMSANSDVYFDKMDAILNDLVKKQNLITK